MGPIRAEGVAGGRGPAGHAAGHTYKSPMALSDVSCEFAVSAADAETPLLERNPGCQAEGVGFEPTSALRRQQFSRLPRSTAPAPLRGLLQAPDSRDAAPRSCG
jgi:hypothetical protein